MVTHLVRRRVAMCADADWRHHIAKMGMGPVVILACVGKFHMQCFKLLEKQHVGLVQ
jgi:hypothetical protein